MTATERRRPSSPFLIRALPDRFDEYSKIENSGSMKVERPVDHAPDWMKEQIDPSATKAGIEALAAAPQKPEDDATVY